MEKDDHNESAKTKEEVDKAFHEFSDEVESLATRIDKSLKNLFGLLGKRKDKTNIKIDKLETLSYDEAVKFILAHKNDSAKIAKAVLLKDAKEKYLYVSQVFLDKDDNILYNDTTGDIIGRVVRAGRLDDELTDIFKDTDMVVME